MLLAYRLLTRALSLPARIFLYLLALSQACRNFFARKNNNANNNASSSLASAPSPLRRARELCGRASQARPREVPLLWLHGVDIGEARIALMLAQELWRRRPHLATLITTTSLPAADLVAKQCDDRLQHQFAPLDNRAWYRKFLKHWQPTLAIRCENEFWPNSIIETARHCPLLFVQARMSERSFRRWRELSLCSQFFSKILGRISDKNGDKTGNKSGNKSGSPRIDVDISKRVMGSIELALCQDENSARYLKQLGVARTKVVGNLKSLPTADTATERAVEHFASLFRNKSLWIAASTHAEEEETIIKAHLRLLTLLPRAICVIAPRNLERVANISRRIKRLAQKFNFPFSSPLSSTLSFPLQLRSQKPVQITAPFYILDSFGELNSLYRWTPVVFVGGSLANRGGHNFFEPARHNCKILHGQHLQNTHAELLHRLRLTQVVENAEDLCKHLRIALAKKGKAPNAQLIIEQHNKAMRKDMLECLEPYLMLLDKHIK